MLEGTVAGIENTVRPVFLDNGKILLRIQRVDHGDESLAQLAGDLLSLGEKLKGAFKHALMVLDLGEHPDV